MSQFPKLREAVNVPDLLERDRLVRRLRAMRADAVQRKAHLEWWNTHHPDEAPFSTAFEDSVIAWCDGRGPLPTLPSE